MADNMVADHMYVESSLETTADGGVRHMNSFVLGEVRTDYEVRVEPDRVRTKEVGIYTPGKLWLKSCSVCELRGPSPTPRGMSVEVCLRHDNSRMRVLLAHAPVEFTSVGNLGKVPSAMLLRDIIIVRERLNSRPIDFDDKPDRMWFKTPASMMEGSFRGVREVIGPSGACITSPVQELVLPSLVLSESKADPDLNEQHKKSYVLLTPDDLNGNTYRHVYPGGVMVEAPSVVAAGDDVRVR